MSYTPVKPRMKAYSGWYHIWIDDVNQFNLTCEYFFKSTCGITGDRL